MSTLEWLSELPRTLPWLPFGTFIFIGAAYWCWCWTPRGTRYYSLLPFFRCSPQYGWRRLPTPRRCIYHRPEAAALNAEVTHHFESTARLPAVIDKITRVLGSGAVPGSQQHRERFLEWIRALGSAKKFCIFRREPLIAGGWAQTVSSSSSACILGLEPFYQRLGFLTVDAAGHELVHVAQEIRELALRKEWKGLGLADALRIEAEAYFLFMMWPFLAAGFAAAAMVGIWQASIHFPAAFWWSPFE